MPHYTVHLLVLECTDEDQSADVNVSQMKYQDQKEFFRLDREHD